MNTFGQYSKFKPYVDSGVLIFGAVVAFWKFIYEGYLVPNSLPPYLKVTHELRVSGEDKSCYFLEVRLTLSNNSRRRVNIAKLNYDLTGIKYLNGTDLDTTLPYDYKLNNKEWASISDEKLDLRTEYVIADSKILSCGNLISRHWLEAGDSDSRTTIIPVSKMYTTCSLRTIALFTKNEIQKNVSYNLFINKDCEFMNLFSYSEYDKPKLDSLILDHNAILNKLELLQQNNLTEIYLKSIK